MLIMLIQKQMVRVKASCVVLLVILLFCASLVASSRRKSTEEVFLSQFADLATGKFDQDLGELLWIICRQDIMLLKDANEDLKHCIPEKGPIWSSQTKLKECAKVLLPLKQNLLDCARKNKNSFHVSGVSNPDVHYADNLYSLSHRPSIPRRNLLQNIAMVPSPAPTVGSPSPAPAPSIDLTLAPSPAPSLDLTLAPSPDPSTPSPAPQSDINSSAGTIPGPLADRNSGNDNRRSIVIAVAVTAPVTFVFAALFFLCCTRVCKGGSRVGQNYERPLLSVSLSDYSAASANKTFGYGNAIKEEKPENQSFDNTTTHDGKGSSMDSNAYMKSDSLHASLGQTLPLGAIGGATKLPVESFETSGNNNPLVPLPPGRMVSNPLLKPLPGRADPLPTVPPASLRPSPSKAGPPPPPPPAPPRSKASTNVSPSPPGPPPPLPMAPSVKPSPRPPPPPGLAPPRPPPPAPFGSKVSRPPLGSKPPSSAASGEGPSAEGDADAPKTKLKPFFWDKVLANPDHSMVWHQIKSGSFQFSEEMIEALFVAAPGDKNKNDSKKESSSQDAATQFVQILDSKKAQNLLIMLRVMNVFIEEVCDALTEGNELPVELLQTLLKMAPTADEELKLRLYSGELSQLGPAERFLKALVDIPFAFKRIEALLFMCNLQDEVASTKESFQTLEIACKELKNSRLFLKLLEAVLKTGNRMNDGTFRGGAQAFKLDTLLKLSDVKGTDGKTTLLHFVVQEIVHSEGVRAARAARENRSLSGISVRTEDLLEEISTDMEEHYHGLGLQAVSRLSTELDNVKKAAAVDVDNLMRTIAKLGHSLIQTKEFMDKEMSNLDGAGEFHEMLKSFVQNAEVDIMSLQEEEKRIMALVKSTGDYFHGKAGKDEGLRLFVIVRNFLAVLDRVCKEVGEAQKRRAKSQRKEASTASSPADNRIQPSPDIRQRLFPAIAGRRADDSDSSSEDET